MRLKSVLVTLGGYFSKFFFFVFFSPLFGEIKIIIYLCKQKTNVYEQQGIWRDYFEASTMKDAKKQAAEDGIALYYKSEVPSLLEEYEVENEEALDEYLWKEFGVDLYLVDDMKEESFPISYVSREDLDHIGYDTSYVSDDTMKRLADKLGDDYCEQLFWSSLDVIADIMGIPKKDTDEEDEEDT